MITPCLFTLGKLEVFLWNLEIKIILSYADVGRGKLGIGNCSFDHIFQPLRDREDP